MQKRKFSREFKLEAVRLIKDRGVAGPRLPATWISTRMCCATGCASCRPIRITRFPVTATAPVQNGVIVAFQCPSQPPSFRCCDDRLNPPNTRASSSSA